MFIKHDLDEFVQAIHLFRPYRYWLRLLPWNWRRRSIKPRAVRLRQALEELGPIFVKFGQVMSTRPDLLPEDIAEELSRLQDQVPPFAGDEAVALIEQAYGKRLHEVFSEFKREPVASASVAQVHFACLHDGTEVAVKVLRPGIWPVIERDLALLDTLASLAHRYSAEMRRLRPKEVVEEFRRTVHNELDMMREAANASQLAANFEGSSLLHVPKIYWDYCRREVLVMERIHGIQISDIDALKRANIDMRQLAHNGVEIFFTQAFRDGFFHADMHPGNIFVTPEGQYQAVDFGIMGTLGELDKRYLAENFIGFFNRNYRAVAEAHLRAGWIPRETRVEEFEAAIRAVCEPVFAKPIKDISFGQLLLNLFQTARQFQMEIQPQLVLLQKTMFQIEGLGRRLYPDLDLWVTAKPYLERWMREQMGPRAFIRTAKREFPKLWQVLPELPGLVYELMHREREGEAIHRWSAPELKELATVFKAQHRRQYFIWIGSAALVSAAVLYSFARLYGNDVVLSGLAIGAVSLGAILLLAAWPCKQ